jgi:hypothetical protein
VACRSAARQRSRIINYAQAVTGQRPVNSNRVIVFSVRSGADVL